MSDKTITIGNIGKVGSIGDIGGDATVNIDQSERKSGEDQTETVAEHKVFISHSHADSGIASRLIDVIETYLRVPPGTIKCTSVPDYELDLGVLTSEELGLELNSAQLVIALLSPNSINAEWVLFELGAAWGRNCKTIPLLTGGLTMDDLPGPLKGRNAGELENIGVLRQLVDNVGKITGWRTDKVRNAETKMEALVSYLETLKWPRQQNRSLKIPRTLLRDFETSYLARKNRLPLSQRRLLEIVERGTTVAQWLHQKVIRQHFSERDSYWRLEQLCCLGFLEKRASGALVGGKETFNYNLSSEYRHELAETYPEVGE